MRIRRVPQKIGFTLLTLGVVGFLGLFLCAPIGAQVVGATVSGTVTDTSGAVIPNCRLSITNVATGVITNATSNGAGFYTVPNLLPGNYEITATAPGFETEENNGIILEVGAQVVENIALKVGQATEKIEVNAAPPDVQLSSSSIGAVVASEAVVELPLNGRSWTDLTDLQPGASQLTTQSHFDNSNDAAARATKGYGAQTSIDGARPVQNNYHIDGISVNDHANGPPSDVTGQSAGVDAIQEFSVLTSNYSAEYGMTSGGTINAITRSGTNQIHGTLYEFIRNSALDARNYFDGPTIAPFRRNQFGGSVGAPIRKNHMFFFANYEGMRQLQAVTQVNIVPSAAARAGTICSQPALVASGTSCTTSTVTASPSSTAYLPFFPLPNAGLLPTGHGDTGTYDFVDPQTAHYDYFMTRVDNKFSEKDSISGTFLYSRSPFTFPDNFDVNITGYNDNYQVYSIQETHVFASNLVNNARVGAFRQTSASALYVSSPNPLATDTSLGSQPGLDAARVSISGLTEFFGGANGLGSAVSAITNFQFYDDANWVRGKHSIKFGFAVERQNSNAGPGSGPEASGLGGTWTFGSLVNYLTNVPATYTSAMSILPIGGISVEKGLRDTILGGYVQDDWHARHNLTFNLGLRYEVSTDPTEIHNSVSVLPSLTATAPRIGGPIFQTNPTLKNVEPRVGFAWDPFGKGKTSIRGGFGLFDSMPLIYMLTNFTGAPPADQTKYSANSLPKGSFYAGAGPYIGGTPWAQGTVSSLMEYYLPPSPPRTYLMQRNLSVQQQLAPSLTVTVSYVGSRGLHLPAIDGDADAVIPTLTTAGWLYPNPKGSGTKINKYWGDIQAEFFDSSSFYDSLQAQVYKRMSHGFQIQGSFTWGKSIDNASSSISQNDFTNALRDPLIYVSPALSRGLSDFNISRNFVLNGIWQIPAVKSLNGFVGAAVNGWQLGTIFKASDGMPFTPTFGTGGNVPGFNNSAGNQNDYPDRLFTGAGCKTAVHQQDAANYVNLNCFTLPTAPNMAFWTANCDHTSKIYGSPATTAPYPVCLNLLGNAGRNSLIGPGQEELDFSIFKNTYVGENKGLDVQFRAEAFNILNRTNFSPPVFGSGTDLYNSNEVPSGSAGLLTYTSTSSRQLQFALKLIF